MAALGLDIPEGEGVSRGEDWFHRAGWTLLGLIIVAALAGLLGPGPLSSRTACAGPGFCVEYERFVRNHAPAELRIRVTHSGEAGPIRLVLGREFLESSQQDSITPEPDRVELLPAGQLHLIEAPRLGPREALIVYHYQPDGAFRDLTIRIGLESGPALRLSQFVYP
jgi:hypothetical protein